MKSEQLGPYALTCPPEVFPLGQDALALGRFAPVRPGWRVCDLGTGSGVLLLLLAGREPSLDLWGVELDPRSAQGARDNLASNGLRGTVLTGDLREPLLPAGGFDLAVANPPYFPAGSGKGADPARMELTCTLDQLCAAAARLVKNGGRFALCHRPERLADVICALRGRGLEPKRLKLLSHGPGHAPSLLLVEARKQGKPGLVIEP